MSMSIEVHICRHTACIHAPPVSLIRLFRVHVTDNHVDLLDTKDIFCLHGLQALLPVTLRPAWEVFPHLSMVLVKFGRNGGSQGGAGVYMTGVRTWAKAPEDFWAGSTVGASELRGWDGHQVGH